MGLVKEDIRNQVKSLLYTIAADEGIDFGSVKVSYELKLERGKCVSMVVEDPVRHTFMFK